jgi:elongation factor Ts
MVEVNCETDFVSSGADFVGFTEKVAGVALASAPAELSALMGLTVEGATVEHQQKTLIAKIGEKISVRRFAVIPRQGSHLGVYLHGTRIGVVVDLKGGSEELARDLAMHVAASKPTCISADQVPTELVAKEREILEAQSKDSGKPADIIAKMVEGRIRKYMAEITLLGQPFVKDPDLTVEKLLKQAGAQVLAFYRFEVGEGIEKKSEDFAAEVMAQVRGS